MNNKLKYAMRIRMLRKVLPYVRSRYKSSRKLMRWYGRDLINRLRYGSRAPVSCEAIFINPQSINLVIDSGIFTRNDSGRIVGGDWDKKTSNIHDFPKYIICQQKFANGKSWEEAGAYQLMMDKIERSPGADGCHSFDDIKNRYEKLDKVYAQVARERKLLSRSNIKRSSFRENGGIYVHIGSGGEIIFGRGGCHRLAITKLLRIKVIPAQLGVVHEAALPYWRDSIIKDYRVGI